MTFQGWLNNNILPIFTNLISWGTNILEQLMNNYIFKIIIYIGIISIILSTIYNIIDLILNKNNKEKEKGN